MTSPPTTADCLTAGPTACFTGPAARATATNFFRLAAPDSVGAQAAADLAIKKLGIARFAVLVHDDPYGRSLGQAFSAELGLMGGKVVFNRTYSPTAVTYAPLLREAVAAGAEAIYMGSASFLGACRVRAAMNGIFPANAYFISGDGIADDPCISDAGTAADDHLVTTISAREPTTVPSDLRAIARGDAHDAYHFAAYDCAEILIAAIDRAMQDN